MKRAIRVGARLCTFESDDRYPGGMPEGFEPNLIRGGRGPLGGGGMTVPPLTLLSAPCPHSQGG